MPHPRRLAHDDYPQTAETIRRAREHQHAEREKANQVAGGKFIFSEDGPVQLAPEADVDRLRELAQSNVRVFPRLSLPIPPSGLSRQRTEDCQMAVDAVCEEFGFQAAERALRIVAAVNGR